MRLFILNDTALPYKVVEIDRIELHDDKIVVSVNNWIDLETYSKHGNDWQPISKDVFEFECNYLKFPHLLNEVYNMVGAKLPAHSIIKHIPHE